MSNRSWRLRVMDILENVAEIEEMTSGCTRDDFVSGSLTARATLRCLGIISEAARYVPPEVQGRHSEVPWREMRGVAGVLPVPYMGADFGIIWESIRNDLPPLGRQLRDVLERNPDPDQRIGDAG